MKFISFSLLPALALAVSIPQDRRLAVRALPPGASVNPTTASGVFGPFTPAKTASPLATGAPAVVNASVAPLLQQACDDWSMDTGIVSNFLNLGNSTPAGSQFNNLAEGAFKAEVDELTHKAVLDQYIGNDPQVSIANLTLTNGVFQSVVDNLDIMAVQGKAQQKLINTINQYRCVQILPSIDTYLAVAARVINGTAGTGVTLRTSVYPTACAAIMAADANNPALFPNVPYVPGGTPLAPSTATSGGTGTNSTTGTGGSTTGNGGGNSGAKLVAGIREVEMSMQEGTRTAVETAMLRETRTTAVAPADSEAKARVEGIDGLTMSDFSIRLYAHSLAPHSCFWLDC